MIYLLIPIMDDEQLFELYKLVKRGYERSCWDTIQESLDYISEYLDTDDGISDE